MTCFMWSTLAGVGLFWRAKKLQMHFTCSFLDVHSKCPSVSLSEVTCDFAAQGARWLFLIGIKDKLVTSPGSNHKTNWTKHWILSPLWTNLVDLLLSRAWNPHSTCSSAASLQRMCCCWRMYLWCLWRWDTYSAAGPLINKGYAPSTLWPRLLVMKLKIQGKWEHSERSVLIVEGSY